MFFNPDPNKKATELFFLGKLTFDGDQHSRMLTTERLKTDSR